MRKAVLPLLLLAAACSTEVSDRAGDGRSEHEGRAGRVAQGIVNGVPDTAGSNSVVFIMINGSKDNFCTGTLIAPNLVLTARHCVADISETSECGTFTKQMSPSSLSIATGVNPGARVATATKIIVDSTKANSGCSNDIALFQLDRDVAGAVVSKVRLSKLTVGEAAKTAGYGDDGSGAVTSGRFVKAGIAVDSVGPASYSYKTKNGQTLPVNVPPGEIVTGESTCFGDSGGPLFDAAGNVIGVTSRGIDESCIDRPSIFSDTASHAQLITDAATAAGHPLQPAAPLPGDTTPGKAEPKGTDTSDDTSDEEEAETSDEEEVTKPTKKKKQTSVGQAQAAGCSMSGNARSRSGDGRSSSIVLAGVALGAALVARRRRRTT
jgi:secreted trypsin-like serine protease